MTASAATWADRPVVEVAAAIRDGELGCVELLEVYLQRATTDTTNAVVTIEAERARREADEADAAVATRQPLGPLHGVPFTAKDALATEGVRSTCGAPELADHVPDTDAVAVRRLRAAGAVLFGKTNTSTWCADIQTHNAVFGPTTNPYAADRSSGGSSGGAAAAVATACAAFDVGTDIGGSIRIPAGFCGTFGHKPSYGLVPSRGCLTGALPVRLEQEINVVGPLARSADDLDLLLSVLAGPDELAARAWTLRLPPSGQLLGSRVAVWLDGGPTPVAARVRERFGVAADALRDAGAVVTYAAPPVDVGAQGRLWRALALSTLAPLVHDEDRARRQAGEHLDWIVRQEERLAAVEAWNGWFEEIDLVLAPVWPDVPFLLDVTRSLGERTIDVDGEVVRQADALLWNSVVGVVGLPATAVPLGQIDGLPVGAQLVAPMLHDRRSIAAAGELAQLLGSG